MLLVTNFGSRYDTDVLGTTGSGYGELVKLAILGYSGQLCMLLVTDFGSRCDPNVFGTSGSSYGELVKTRTFVLFWPVLYAITHRFWAPLRSKRTGNPEVRFRGTHQYSQFWSILASFVYYYSLILGPAAIRTFRESRGPVMGKSSKLAFLAYSGQVCMLLFSDFGSHCDPNVSGTPWSGYGDFFKTRSFGLFRPVLYAISH
jgi:hypothetical protein